MQYHQVSDMQFLKRVTFYIQSSSVPESSIFIFSNSISGAHDVKIEDKDADEISFAITILISSSGILSCALIILLLMIIISKIQKCFEHEELELDKGKKNHRKRLVL